MVSCAEAVRFPLEKQGEVMPMISFNDMLTFGLFVVALIGLVVQITKK